MDRRTLLAALLLPVPAQAHSLSIGAIAIGHAWALPANHVDGQALMPIVNRGDKPEELVAARSEICGLIEFRRNARYDDPPLDRFTLDPGVPLPMRPGARHLRLANLARPLEAGADFIIILDFLNAGEVEVEVMIEASPND